MLEILQLDALCCGGNSTTDKYEQCKYCNSNLYWMFVLSGFDWGLFRNDRNSNRFVMMHDWSHLGSNIVTGCCGFGASSRNWSKFPLHKGRMNEEHRGFSNNHLKCMNLTGTPPFRFHLSDRKIFRVDWFEG